MNNPLDNKIIFRAGPIYITPFTQEIPIVSAQNLTKETLYTKLSQYNKARVRDDKKSDSYNLTQLKEIAEILGIRKSQNKDQLVKEILKKWDEQFSEL